MTSLTLRGDHITLVQAVKVAGLADSGGHAKHCIREGQATVNGVIEIQPGRKLIVGDRFSFQGGREWVISGAEPAAAAESE